MNRAWRTPGTIVALCAIVLNLALGLRFGYGLLMKPMSADLGFGREVLSLTLAVAGLTWGLSQPFTGAIADRIGAGRVLLAGAILSIIGSVSMAYATSPLALILLVGVVGGIGSGAMSFGVVFGIIGRNVPAEARNRAITIATAAGSFGQFLFVPYTQALINALGWQGALLALAATTLVLIPVAAALAEPPAAASGAGDQSIRQAIGEAFAERNFRLLLAGYFVCGFHVMFVSTHFPAYVSDRGFSANVGATALALIALFNILGTYTWGMLGGRYVKKNLLSMIYALRSVAVLGLLYLPASEATFYAFAAAFGFLYLSTVPLTTGVIGTFFGVRYLGMLSGAATAVHQVGAFVGIWLGGRVFDALGSYDAVWWVAVALGVFAALINLPIREAPVARLRAA
ncbi:MAG: MFS transporter [Burkholderiales bacterium]|nr:MFS transporter [Burkholderiales bacterium]